MTAKEIEKTLGMLRDVISKQRHVYGVDDKIEIHIGRNLAAWIRGYNEALIWNCYDGTVKKTLFGYPVIVVNDNPMCLEVHIVEKVPLYKESEVGNEQNS